MVDAGGNQSHYYKNPSRFGGAKRQSEVPTNYGGETINSIANQPFNEDTMNFDHTVLLEKWSDYFTEECLSFYVR